MAFEITGATHIGSVRKSNEDNIAWHVSDDSKHIMGIVADGMGGYQGGELASSIAVETFTEQITKTLFGETGASPTDIPILLDAAAKAANIAIIEARKANEDLSKMGTTLVAVNCTSEETHIIHAGDSRCYHYVNKTLHLLTRDDSVVQDMLDSGAINPKDIDRVPFRNVLTKALGSNEQIDFTVNSVAFEPGEQLLLCSDGIYNTLSEHEIERMLTESANITDCSQNLIQHCLEKTASDNISVVIIKAL